MRAPTHAPMFCDRYGHVWLTYGLAGLGLAKQVCYRCGAVRLRREGGGALHPYRPASERERRARAGVGALGISEAPPFTETGRGRSVTTYSA